MTTATVPRLVPKHGTFAEPWLDPATGRWVARLTDEGRAKCAEYCAKWPNPVAYLRGSFPGHYHALRRSGLTDDDLHALCLRAVVMAHVRWRPAESGITTVVWWALRCEAVKELARLVKLNTHELSASHWFGSSWDDEDHPPIEPEAPAQAPDPDLPSFDRLLALLTGRQRVVVQCLYGEGLACHEVAVKLRTSRQLVSQLRDGAFVKLRRALGLATARERCEWDALVTAMARRKRWTSRGLAVRCGLDVKLVRSHLAHLVAVGRVAVERPGRGRVFYRLERVV